MFEAQIESRLYGIQRKSWILLFFVVVWTIWGLRNKVIFENGVVQWDSTQECIRHRWLRWAKEWLKDAHEYSKQNYNNVLMHVPKSTNRMRSLMVEGSRECYARSYTWWLYSKYSASKDLYAVGIV